MLLESQSCDRQDRALISSAIPPWVPAARRPRDPRLGETEDLPRRHLRYHSPRLLRGHSSPGPRKSSSLASSPALALALRCVASIATRRIPPRRRSLEG